MLRILDKGNLTLDLEKFGIEPEAERDLMEAILNPYGMVLVTGPTGSGKTTTLYSALSKVNTIDVNIMTAEDPVEYNLMGINQVLVRTEIGMTFAAALKAFLRQDPNIIMVGEIRDLETGGIAIKAALTGHLVLSTLHTNDAPEHDHPSDRHGHRAVQRARARSTWSWPSGSCGASARTARLSHKYTRRRNCSPWAQILTSLRALHVHEGQGLRDLRRHRLQGPGGPLRGHGHDARSCAG